MLALRESEKNPLKRWSIDPRAEATRLSRLPPELRQKELAKNLDTYVNEVIENQPVSLVYQYWFDNDGNLYTGQERLPIQNAINQIDPQERNGLPRIGFVQLQETLLHHQDEAVLWYSPVGKAGFADENDNPYSEITYDYGQLYIYSFNGDAVDAVAVKVSNEHMIRALFQKLGLPVVLEPDGSYEAIRSYLLNPYAIGMSVDELLSLDIDLPIVFTDKKENRDYFWSEIAQSVKIAFAGDSQNGNKIPTGETMDMLNKHFITKEDITGAYMMIILRSMDVQGISKIELFGSCGGSEIQRTDVETILGLNRGDMVVGGSLIANLLDRPFEELVGLHSSALRKIIQSESKTTYEPGTCIDCHENKDKVGNCGICTDCEKNYD